MTGKANALTAQGLSMLRGVGGWMAIGPEKTYVASSIRGFGTCRSTYVAPTRRDLPEREAGQRLHASLLLAAIAALGILSACATRHPAGRASAGCAAALADCQKDAAPVSPGAANRAGLVAIGAGDDARLRGDFPGAVAVAGMKRRAPVYSGCWR